MQDLKGFKTCCFRTQKIKSVPKGLWLVTWLYLVKTAQKNLPAVFIFFLIENYISNSINCFSTKTTVLVELLSPTRKLYSHCVPFILTGRSSHCTALAQALSTANSRPDLISLITRPFQFTGLGWQRLPVHSQPWLSYTTNLPGNSTAGLIQSLSNKTRPLPSPAKIGAYQTVS